MTLLGVDPGLAACGLAVVDLLSSGATVRRVGVIRTAPSARRRRLRALDDLGGRLRVLAIGLHAQFQELEDLVAVCIEAAAIPFRGGRMNVRPSAVSALGRVRGLVDAFAAERDLPIIEETPQALKLLTAGKRDASKARVQESLERRFPEVRGMWPAQRTMVEHAADALAAVVAGLESDVVRAALRAADSAVARSAQGGSP
jgi:Holliday junction resolvasome RuvABC endonuclease subunit